MCGHRRLPEDGSLLCHLPLLRPKDLKGTRNINRAWCRFRLTRDYYYDYDTAHEGHEMPYVRVSLDPARGETQILPAV